MSFHRYVARRYLFGALGREGGRLFLRFITLVAVGGVTVGVAMLLLALSIVRGFSREIEAKVIGFGAHVQVENIRHAPLTGAAEKAAHIRMMEGVQDVQPVVSEFALLRQSQAAVDGVSLWGTDSLPAYLNDMVTAGSPALLSDGNVPLLVIGASLARNLGLSVGDSIVVFSMRRAAEGSGSLLAIRPRLRQFQIGGLYETSLADFDLTYVFTDVGAARRLLDYAPDEVTRLDVTLVDAAGAGQVAEEIEEVMGIPVLARTIFEVYRGLFAWVQLQEAIIPLVIGVLILVAAFNIVGTLLMVIMEKTREIGILSSMGASRQALQRLFVSLGLMIGVAGTGAGMSLALILALIQKRYEVIPLPAEAYYMTTAPIALNPLDFVLVALVSMLLTTVAAYIPARVAARMDPLKIIRLS